MLFLCKTSKRDSKTRDFRPVSWKFEKSCSFQLDNVGQLVNKIFYSVKLSFPRTSNKKRITLSIWNHGFNLVTSHNTLINQSISILHHCWAHMLLVQVLRQRQLSQGGGGMMSSHSPNSSGLYPITTSSSSSSWGSANPIIKQEIQIREVRGYILYSFFSVHWTVHCSCFEHFYLVLNP